MTEQDAINNLNADAAAAEALATEVTGDFADFNQAVSDLDAALGTVAQRLNQLTENITYAMENYL